jgi:hypothetical protein
MGRGCLEAFNDSESLRLRKTPNNAASDAGNSILRVSRACLDRSTFGMDAPSIVEKQRKAFGKHDWYSSLYQILLFLPSILSQIQTHQRCGAFS